MYKTLIFLLSLSRNYIRSRVNLKKEKKGTQNRDERKQTLKPWRWRFEAYTKPVPGLLGLNMKIEALLKFC